MENLEKKTENTGGPDEKVKEQISRYDFLIGFFLLDSLVRWAYSLVSIWFLVNSAGNFKRYYNKWINSPYVTHEDTNLKTKEGKTLIEYKGKNYIFKFNKNEERLLVEPLIEDRK